MLVSLSREIERTCFDHALSKFSGFPWEPILFLKFACVNMVMQIRVQIGDTKRVFFFFMNPSWSVEDFKKYYILREIPKTSFMDFGLLYENDKGEYVVLNGVRMADIRLASLVYLFVYVSTYCVPIALLRQNKPFPLLYLGHAQKMSISDSLLRELQRWITVRGLPMKTSTYVSLSSVEPLL